MKIIDITPQRFLCEVVSSCPAVFKVDNHTYHIIGRTIDSSEKHVRGRVADNETVIEVPAELLEQALTNT